MAHEKFILGFIAGEGSFNLKLMSDSSDVGYKVVPCFEVNLDKRELQTAKFIQKEMPVDMSLYEKESGFAQLYYGGYTNISDIFDWVEEHADKPFTSSDKYKSMQKMEKIVSMMDEGMHKDQNGLVKILEVRDEMNGEGHVNKKSASDLREEFGV